MKLINGLLCLAVCSSIVAACGGGGYAGTTAALPPAPSPPPPPPPPPPIAALNGYFAGSVNVGGNGRYAEALLAADGAFRIYVGGSSGAIFDADDALQFVGQIEFDGDQAFGSGIIIGQHCAIDPGPYCASPASGEIEISVATRSLLAGEIRVATTEVEPNQPWLFEMSWPTNTYVDEPATTAFAQGQYQETLAEFASQDDVTINVDDTGAIFFQSAGTSCVGNGILTPYLSGEFNVYGARMTIDNCVGTYAYMNGDFEGLATRTVGDEWGDWLLIWLSSPDGSSSWAAITMWGSNMDNSPWDY